MASRIFAGNNKTTAIANIKADIATFISFNSDGVKVLDTEGFRAYLYAQVRLISTSGEAISPATASSVLSAAENAPIQTMVNNLNATISVAHWQARADWPTATAALTGGIIVSAVQDAFTACAPAAAAVSAYYADINTRLSDAITTYYEQQNIDALVPDGVVRVISTRAAIYTYVTDKDEESAPSPASELVDMDQNDTATYGATAPPAGRNVNRIRWYRSESSNNGAAFAFVVESPVANLTYIDSKEDEELEEPCPSTTWIEPPATLQGLVAGPNGAHAGFEGSNFWPCENDVPYAFPSEYRKTTAWPIVGIGTFNQTYVVLTRGKPYFMTGTDSASLDSQPIDSTHACVSRRSIVSMGGGVVYAAPDGLCLASPNGIQLLTADHFTREEWSALVPASIFAAEREGAYVFRYNTGSVSGAYAIDPRSGRLTTQDLTGSAFYRDLVTDTLYIAQLSAIKALFSADTRLPGVWKTKKAVMAGYANFGWLQVDSEFEDMVSVKVWRDGVLTDTVDVLSAKPVRLTSGRGLEMEFEVTSTAKITGITLASTAAELKQV